jgi:hypothetical protein
MDKQPKNKGEGNTEAAERFNASEKEFVESPRGKKKVRQGPCVHPDEEWSLQEAERLGKERAKGGPESIVDLEKTPDE